MTNTPADDVAATLEQISRTVDHGAEIVRIAVPDTSAAHAVGELVEASPVPLVADIHFDPDLAILSLRNGIHKLRINPGNIRRKKDVFRIAEEAGKRGTPIRIGVNSGSVPGDIRDRYGGVNADSLWAAAERHIGLLGETGFEDIVLSIKASDPMLTVEANRLAADRCGLPLHLGVTEAGPLIQGCIRSAVALSLLLSEGIGDTIRVSLTAPPQTEATAAWEILSSLDIRRRFPRIVSCPTCSRRRIDVAAIAEDIQEHLASVQGDFTVAVMGCEVNGPGEAREAELAVIGTPAGMLLFADGRNLGETDREHLLTRLDELIRGFVNRSRQGGTM
jgi:(E)-4-hydroxy-3-methylbut-2-enyl-diphosphate synthase